MSTKNICYSLIPQYLFSPNIINPNVYTCWNDNNQVYNLELRPLKSTLYYLRNMIEYIMNCLHVSPSQSSINIMFMEKFDRLKQLYMKYKNSTFEICLLIQILELFMYIFNTYLHEEYLSLPSSTSSFFSSSSSSSSSTLSISNSSSASLSKSSPIYAASSYSTPLVKKLPKLIVLPYRQCKLYIDELNSILYSIFMIGRPLIVLDCPILMQYFNNSPTLNTTKIFTQFTLQPKLQNSLAADLLYINILCQNLDETQICNLLTQQGHSIDLLVLINDLLYCIEKQVKYLQGISYKNNTTNMDNSNQSNISPTNRPIFLINKNVLSSNNEERVNFSNLNKLLK